MSLYVSVPRQPITLILSHPPQVIILDTPNNNADDSFGSEPVPPLWRLRSWILLSLPAVPADTFLGHHCALQHSETAPAFQLLIFTLLYVPRSRYIHFAWLRLHTLAARLNETSRGEGSCRIAFLDMPL